MNGSTLDQEDEELGCAVADYEHADGPEDYEETVTGKDASVEDQDGDFCEGDGGVVKNQVGENDLVR